VNLAHLHLLLNHFPTVGAVIGLGLFVGALVTKNDGLERTSMLVLLLIAVSALPVYFSGNAALEAIQSRPDVSKQFVARHQDVALLALVLMGITGALAWRGLWQFRRNARPAAWNVYGILLFSLLTVALMTVTATMGGEIRHEEIRPAQDVSQTEGTVSAMGAYVLAHGWVWPTCETLHFIGLCLLLGTILTVDLRMLGIMKSVPLADLRGLIPWALAGFSINLVTGMVFFIATPTQYTQNVAFYWKIVFMLLAGINVLYLTFDESWALPEGVDAPLTAKVVAGAGIFLWLGVIFFGRMLPFIGNSF